MMPLERFRTPTVLFAAVAALAAGLGLSQWTSPAADPMARPLSPWQPPVSAEQGPPPTSAAQQDFAETFARPVFAPSRRPFKPPEQVVDVAAEPPAFQAAPPAAPPDASSLALKGIMIGETVEQALVFSGASAQSQWLTVGMDVQGYKLVEIKDDLVVLEGANGKVELKLYANAAQGTTGALQPDLGKEQ